MNRIKNQSRKKACYGKIKYATMTEAAEAARSAERHYKAWLTPYPCRYCGGFHFGHPPRQVRQSIIARRKAGTYKAPDV